MWPKHRFVLNYQHKCASCVAIEKLMIPNNWNDVFKIAETIGIKIVPNVPVIGIELKSKDSGKLYKKHSIIQ